MTPHRVSLITFGVADQDRAQAVHAALAAEGRLHLPERS